MVDYLAEAFKALDDVEDVMPCLHEEMFTVDSDGLSELADFEVESEKSEDKKRVIDPEAKNEEELKSSYVGKVIIDCNQCHSKIYKDKEDIVIDGEDVNKEEECPYCFATEGFKVVGEVAPYTETKVDVEAEDKDNMTEGVRRRHRAAKKMGKRVVEEFNGSYHTWSIIEDLVDRAKLIYKEQADPDISEAVMQAIDDGLIYDEDILELAGAYGVIDYGELVDKFIDDLSGDMTTHLELILAEEDDELKEAVKGRRNRREKRINEAFYRGNKSIKFVYNGDYADPDLIYNGYTFNYWDIEGALWEDFLDRVEDGDIGVSFDREFAEHHDDDDAVEDAFNLYVQENGVDYLNDVIYGGYFEKGSKSWHDRYKRDFAESKKPRHKGKLTESDRIRRRDIDSIPYNRKRMSGRVRKDLDIDEKKSDNPRHRDEDEKRARRIDRKVNSLKERKFDEDLGDDVAKYQRWVDYDMKRYGKISDKTKSYLDRAGLEVVKDDHDDYEVIAKDEGLSESLNEVEVKTDTDKIKISSETITKDEEMAIPVTDDTKDEIIAGDEEEDASDEIVADDEDVIADDEEEDTVDDIEEFDEESFDELSESYLKKVYSNVDGYKTSNVSFNKSGLCVEGIISFKSGNKKNTQFIFESRDNGKRFVGENKQITRGKKAFTVKGSVKDGKFITESFNYRYSAINPQTGKSENLYETLKRGK